MWWKKEAPAMAAQVIIGKHVAEVINGRWVSRTPGLAEMCQALCLSRGSDAFRALSVARVLQQVKTKMRVLDE
jgi:hypothetical protein